MTERRSGGLKYAEEDNKWLWGQHCSVFKWIVCNRTEIGKFGNENESATLNEA